MKEIKVAKSSDMTSLKQKFSSWTDFDTNSLDTGLETEDIMPFRKPPAPLPFNTPEILSRVTPDPLLAITPEKSLGRVQSKKKVVPPDGGDGVRKGRPRVRFAPDTRTSPPSKKDDAESEKESGKKIITNNTDFRNDDDESVPRNFSTVSQKLYQPGRYADGDDNLTSSTPAPVSSTSAPKRYTVETRGGNTVYVPLDQSARNITSMFSDSSNDKPVTAKIVRHKPTSSDDDTTNMEVKQVLESSSKRKTTQPSLSRSPSPSRRRKSPQHHRNENPSRIFTSPSSSRGSSPSRTPDRLTPISSVEFLTSDFDEKTDVMVIREAPYQPKLGSYIFPFEREDEEEEREEYDSSKENVLARPEFNSALKIGEELKSVRGRQPDTWGAVSQKLKSNDRKRSEIQEKASSKVNIRMQSGLYSDLVDVDAPVDSLCHNLERGITLRAPSPRRSAARVPVGREPDIMEFFSPELQQELPDLTLTGIQPIADSLTTANPALAFDLYRHNRAWNGLTDN